MNSLKGFKINNIHIIMQQIKDHNNLYSHDDLIDINYKHYYESQNPIRNDRTRKRLQTLINLNMIEVGNCEFGIKHVVSGLYIERVWEWDDNRFNDYIDWVKEILIKNRCS